MSLPAHPSPSPNFSQRSFGSAGLPPLPHIRDRRLQTQIFTHRSLARRPKRSFEDSPDDPSPDNEQLVHIGDPVFSLVVTDLIRDLFPNLSVGPSSKVRDRLKHTATLARVAVLYSLHDRLLVQNAQANEVKGSQNAQAEVFKAYVGGLYREQGMGPVNDWLRSLFQLLHMRRRFGPYRNAAYSHWEKNKRINELGNFLDTAEKLRSWGSVIT